MGFIINKSELDKILNHYDNFLIFSCLPLKIMRDKLKNYDQLKLGELLSAELMKIDKEERSKIVVEKLEEILISKKTDKLLITNIDILFNPNYRLDIIKLFIQLSRNKKNIIHWPGKYHSENLVYSKPEYADYKRYSIKEYDVICLK